MTVKPLDIVSLVPRETIERLELYLVLLRKWQAKINLVASGTLSQAWERHFLDSLSLFSHLQATDNVADLGSGGGFPGMVLAIAHSAKMTLIESDGRKVAFLREVARATHTDVTILECRVENCELSGYSALTARAFAPLSRILEWTGSRLPHHTRLLFLKGKTYETEIEKAESGWEFRSEIHPDILTGGALIILRNVKRRTL